MCYYILRIILTLKERTEMLDTAQAETTKMTGFFESLGFNNIWSTLISAVLVLILCVIVINLLSKITKKVVNKLPYVNETVKRFVVMAEKIVLWVIAITVVCGTLGIPTSSIVAMITVVGAALSLSLQNVLTNLFSGLTLLFTKPIAVGEFCEISSRTGTVQSIGLFYTTLKTMNGEMITVPNREVTEASILNYTREPVRRVSLKFDAEYRDDSKAVMAALRAAYDREVLFLRDPAPEIFIDSFQESSVRYGINAWVASQDYLQAVRDMNLFVREEFENHGVSMSYNHINVHMIDDSKGK